MNKSLLTNLIAGSGVVVAYFSPAFFAQTHLLQASLFALSGALTNWLAIHMLFEKIPGLYGSGIIPLHFEEFKSGIRALIMDNFFTEENFAQLTQETLATKMPLEQVAEQVDFNELFDGFIVVIKKSHFGGMLGMIGGEEALEPLREPFKEECDQQIKALLGKIDMSSLLNDSSGFEEFRPKVEKMIDLRLAELTPEQVKQIIDQMIREHLGWLVVWGGVFGALIGLVSSFLFA